MSGNQRKSKGQMTPLDAAEWMWAEFQKADGYLSRSDAVAQVRRRFGERYIDKHKDGDDALRSDVLKEWDALHGGQVVLDGDGQSWRWRNEGEGAGPGEE